MTSSFTSWESSSSSSGNYEETKRQIQENFGNTPNGLFHGPNFSQTKPSFSESNESNTDLGKQLAALKEREAKLDEREEKLAKQLEAFAQREDELDAAHEKLIGGGDEEEEEKAAKEAESAGIIEELRRENERLRSELESVKQKSNRFLSVRAREDAAAGADKFKLSERKPKGAGSLPMGFDPELMEKWSIGHSKMAPREPKKSIWPEGK